MISAVSANDNQTDVLSEDNDDALNNENNSLSDFKQDLSKGNGTFNLEKDYAYNSEKDNGSDLKFKTGNLTINGNNHIIDGNNSASCFYFEKTDDGISMNLTVNDLTFKNFKGKVFDLYGGTVNFNNVNFTDCDSLNDPLVYAGYRTDLTADNCNFYSTGYTLLRVDYAHLSVLNTRFYNTGNISLAIMIHDAITIDNCTFDNFHYEQGGALYHKGYSLIVKNSIFRNSYSDFNGGAIIAKFKPFEDSEGYKSTGDFIVENCVFSNLSALNDGGAIYLDMDSGSKHVYQGFNITNSNFTDCKSNYGGAVAVQGGIVNIKNSNFKNNNATLGGGLYSSWSDVNLFNTTFSSNTAKNAGALYFDKGKLTVTESDFYNNKAYGEGNETANCIYAYDVDAKFANSNFDNGGISVYADFASDSNFTNVTKNNDTFLLDNKNYVISVETPGIKLNFTNNSFNVDKLPSRYDPRDWGWITPFKYQGDNYDCWAFATVASLETSLIKTTGIAYNLSVNYVQKLQLKYYKFGDRRICFTGFDTSGLGYALSWIGALQSDSPYDDRSMITDTDLEVPRIHVQDAMFIYGGRNDTIDLIKRAVLKYGAVTIHSGGDLDIEINPDKDPLDYSEHYIHFVSIVGWDDNYSRPGLNITGAWIVKDSLFDDYENSYFLSPFLEKDSFAIVPQNYGIAYIFENNIDYNVNYQTDITGLTGFDGNYTYYSNEFTSKYSELIGAVGTYFNESGINYSFDVYVNGKLVHTQYGVSEFAGFKTIVLDKYIPVKEGDKFKVVFKNNALPYQAFSRQHYLQNMTFVSADGKTWKDITLDDRTVCLKVYTVKDDSKIISNENITVDYTGGKYFSVRVVTADNRSVGAGAVVNFTINGKTYTRTTDSNGVAKIKITQLPKKYTIKTTYNGITYKNTVTVKQVLTASKVTIKKSSKKLVLKAKLKINGKLIKGKKITFKFKGKTYKVKTTKKGIAKKTLKKNVIKKLKKGKKYKVKVTYSKTSIKTKVIVK